MKQLFLNSVQLLKEASSEEKEAATLIYATAFIRMMRLGGYLYKRALNADGIPCIIMTIDGQDYRCQEYILAYFVNNTMNFIPYEDTTIHLYETELLPSQNVLQDYQIQSEKKKINLPEVELPKITVEEKTPFEGLPVTPELTLTEEQQADFLLDETERYKIGAGLNAIMGFACIIFAVLIMVWL